MAKLKAYGLGGIGARFIVVASSWKKVAELLGSGWSL